MDIIAACQHWQGGHQEDDQALDSDAGEMRDTGHKFEHKRLTRISGKTFSPRGQSYIGGR